MSAEQCSSKSWHDEDNKFYVFEFYLSGCQGEKECALDRISNFAEAIVFANFRAMMRAANPEISEEDQHLPKTVECQLEAGKRFFTRSSTNYLGAGRYRVDIPEAEFIDMMKLYIEPVKKN